MNKRKVIEMKAYDSKKDGPIEEQGGKGFI